MACYHMIHVKAKNPAGPMQTQASKQKSNNHERAKRQMQSQSDLLPMHSLA